MKIFSDYGIDTGGRTGQFKTRCPKCSPSRRKSKDSCLSVNTYEGVWNCHHCGWSGTLKKGAEKMTTYKRQKIYTKPEPVQEKELPEEVIKYFAIRGISAEVLRRNSIGYEKVYMPQTKSKINAICFYFKRDDESINIKYRDENKNFRLVSGAELIFYGIDDCKDVVIVIIVEGEIDKLSLEMAGFTNVMSVPNGAPPPNSNNYDTKLDYLDSASDILGESKTVILATDNDEAGKKLEEELSRRIGREKCRVVQFPEGCKDANDVLVKHGKETLKRCIEDAQPYPIEGIYGISDLTDEINKLYHDGFKRGVSTGFRSLDEFYTVKGGELTLVTGIPSHGKSEFVDALMMNISQSESWRFGIYSPENQPLERHAAKLIEKHTGKPFKKEDNI